MKHRWLLAVLAVVFAAYLAVSQAGWAWDDHALLQANTTLEHPTWEAIWQHDLWYGARTRGIFSPYYRPLTTISFLIDFQMGLKASLAHLHSLAWHLLNISLLYALLRRHIGDTRAAVAGLLFGLHPIQSEAVVWIAARNDLMATAGTLGSLLLLERRSRLAFLPILVSCLSKESSYLFPVLLLAWRLAFPIDQEGWKGRIREILWIAPGLLLPFLLRLQAELGPVPSEYRNIEDPLRTAWVVGVTVLGWLGYPWPLTTSMTIFRTEALPTAVVSAFAVLALYAYLIIRNPRRNLPLLGMVAVAYAPALGAVVTYSIVGERYLYLPMVGLVTIIAASLPEPLGKGLTGGLVVWSLMSLGLLHLRLPDWANSEVLWRAAVARAPDSYSLQLLGSELQVRGNAKEALELYDRSLEMRPVRVFSCDDISTLALRFWTMEQINQRLPVWVDAGCRNAVGFDAPIVVAYASLGRWEEAEKWLRSAHRVDDAKRDRVVKGALALRDGDLTMLQAEALIWPGGPASYLDQVLIFTNNRRALP